MYPNIKRKEKDGKKGSQARFDSPLPISHAMQEQKTPAPSKKKKEKRNG